MGELRSCVGRWLVVWYHDDGEIGAGMESVVNLLVINVCGAKGQKWSEGTSVRCGSGSGGGIPKCMSLKFLKQEWLTSTRRGTIQPRHKNMNDLCSGICCFHTVR